MGEAAPHIANIQKREKVELTHPQASHHNVQTELPFFFLLRGLACVRAHERPADLSRCAKHVRKGKQAAVDGRGEARRLTRKNDPTTRAGGHRQRRRTPPACPPRSLCALDEATPHTGPSENDNKSTEVHSPPCEGPLQRCSGDHLSNSRPHRSPPRPSGPRGCTCRTAPGPPPRPPASRPSPSRRRRSSGPS